MRIVVHKREEGLITFACVAAVEAGIVTIVVVDGLVLCLKPTAILLHIIGHLAFSFVRSSKRERESERARERERERERERDERGDGKS
jgi:hypothetical protein